mgnify:CR=1 FL=1
MKRQLIHFLTKNTDAYRNAALQKARNLKENATKGAANASGEAFYQVIRIQAIASVVIFINIVIAVSINYAWEKWLPESYDQIGHIAGFLFVLFLYLLLALLLPRLKKPVVRLFSRLTRKPIEKQVNKRLGKVEQQLESFDPNQLQLPLANKPAKTPASSGSSRKKQVQRVLIAGGAGLAAMLVVRKLTQKKKTAQRQEPSRAAAAGASSESPFKKAAVEVLTQAGKQLALEFIRGLSQKEDKKEKSD